MKKIYSSPAIETTETLYFASVLCDSVNGDNMTGGGGMFAPKKKDDKLF